MSYRTGALAIAAALALAFVAIGRPQSPEPKSGRAATPISQGEYSELRTLRAGEKKLVPIDHWRMIETEDGNYSVEIQRLPLSEPFRVDERHVFTKTMNPLSADMVLAQASKLHCDYGPNEITCTLTTADGAESAASRLNLTKPYAFTPMDQAVISDLPWTEQMWAVQADPPARSVTRMPLITFFDAGHDDKQGGDPLPRLLPRDSAVMESFGPEEIQILNRGVLARKLCLQKSDNAELEEQACFWLSRPGLLLRVASGNTVSLELTSYQGPKL